MCFMSKLYWLMKSEPSVYGILDLKRDGQTLWDGVRNYQARNFLQQMTVGDRAFFYHSNVQPPGIVGLMQISRTGLPDPSQFDAASDYFDPKATPEDPRWWTVEVTFEQQFSSLISLETLRQHFSPDQLAVVRKGNRLSVMPVAPDAAEQILRLLP
jgi:predicted RNA-binding protein with PUA-like domain